MRRNTTLIILIPILVFIAQATSGQSGDEILKRLKAKPVKSNIFLFIHDDKVKYKHDVEDVSKKSDGAVLVDSVSPMWMAKSPSLQLSIGFYNPYQYTVKVTSLNSDDPLAKSTEQLMEALLSMVGTITTGLPVNLGNSDNARGFEMQPSTVLLDSTSEKMLGTENIDEFKNASLIEWFLWIQQTKFKDCLSSREQITNLAKNASIAEEILEGDFSVDGEELMFNAHVLSVVSTLYEPVSVKKFSQALVGAGEYYKSLGKKLIAAGDALEALKALNKLNPFNATADCLVPKTYQNLIFNQYIIQAQEKLDKQKKILKTLHELISVGNKFVKDNRIYNDEGEVVKVQDIRHLDLEDDKINTVTLDITHNEIDTVNASVLKTQNQFKRSFQLTKFRRAWPEFSSGLFFSDVEYNIFSEGASTIIDGTDTTVVSVVQKTAKKQNFMAAVFYNHVFDFQLHPLYPFVQVGVGSSKDYPAVVLGGGARYISKVSKPFSVSFGMVLPFTRELEGLEENLIITGGQAEIDRHIRYKFGRQIGFYVGLNIKVN